MRGIGEKFSASPVTGTGAMAVPIALSPGRAGFGPQLALSYDSGAGNGPWGLGWNVALPSIIRKTDKGLPRYLDGEDSDTFLLAGAEDLVPVLRPDGIPAQDEPVRVHEGNYRVRRYRPRIEGLFALIERWTDTARAGNVFWRSISRDNVTSWFGRTPDSRVRDPSDASRIFEWRISESYDSTGNVIVYSYQREDGAGVRTDAPWESNRILAGAGANTYLKRIRYGNLDPFLPSLAAEGPWEAPSGDVDRWMFEVVLDYGDHRGASPGRQPDGPWAVRADPFSSHRSGFEIRTWRLCRRVLMFHHFPRAGAIAAAPEVGGDCLVRSTDLEYADAGDLADPGTAGYAILRSIVQRSYQRRTADAVHYEQRQLPPLTFTYSPIEVDPTVRVIGREELENLPAGTQGSGFQWVDLDGEGLSGVLTEQAGAWHYKSNLGEGRFGPTRVVARQPAMAALAGGRQQLMDLAGDGTIDLVDFSGPTPGFHERSDDGGWKQHVPFASLPDVDWNAPNLRFVDLTGDGHADALITDDEVFTWHPSLDERGFGASRRSRKSIDEEAGPRVVFSDPEQAIFLADMCGDGLADIVRIRHREVCYWPNLGYGRFGRKVTLGNPPRFDAPDQFDPARIRLTDIDGSGPVDIIYLGRSGAQLYFNRSGNSLSNARHVPLPLATANLAAVQAADLLGNGTACLVWNSPLPADADQPVRYVRLMGAPSEDDTQWRKHAKPHLLITVQNNLGASTAVEYRPSTWFYLQDKLAGRPWVTRLPFPVHCVSKVTVHDAWRGTHFSSSYSYHHGYFDGTEREFRGFGRVEQVDIEDFDFFRAENAGSPWITRDQALFQPPVQTITWYHTGAALDRRGVLSRFVGEYFPQRFATQLARGPGTFAERPLPEPELPADLDAGEWREALRACKGMVLRQEVYELDPAGLGAHPGTRMPVRLFTAATHNCRIQRLQHRGKNRQAVFLVTESEAITYHHELTLRASGQAIANLRPDPRIAHTLNLRTDEYGNVQQSVAVAYARWQPGDYAWLPRPQLALDVQAEEHVAYTETRYTNVVALRAAGAPGTGAVRHFRLPATCEVRTYELKGIRRSGGAYFTPADFAPLDLSDFYEPLSRPSQAVAARQYHEAADGSVAQKRLVEHVRSLYYDDASDTATPSAKLPFGSMGPRALKFEDYKLALTDALLAAIFGRPEAADPMADRLAWELAPGVPARALLGDASISGYTAGTTIDAALAGQYWMRSGRAGFTPESEAYRHFFLPDRYDDAFGNRTLLRYDDRDLFVASSTDARHNEARVARFDHRVLSPAELVDVNGNRSEAVFDILGLVVAVATKGKRKPDSHWEGDHLDGWTFDAINPPAEAVAAFCTSREFTHVQEQLARNWLGTATSRFVYDFGESYAAAPPAWLQRMAGACAITRETPVGTLPRGTQTRMQLVLECSDGSGATLMKKVQAEPDPASTAMPRPRRWIVNGLVLLNNKGKPVRQYEPDFSPDFGCEIPRANGVSSTLFYDAAGRVVRTEYPDGTLSRVVFSPWETESWDQNDTVLESPWYASRSRLDPAAALSVGANSSVNADAEQRAGWLAARHARTPARTILDSLGRDVISVAHNRGEATNGPHRFGARQWADERYVTFSKLDAEGKPLWIRDARGNLVMQYVAPAKPTRWADQANESLPAGSAPCYDLAGNLLHQRSMDAGDRWMLADAAGKPMLAWDFSERQENGGWTQEHRLYGTNYDGLHRPTAGWLRTWRRRRPAAGSSSPPYQAGDRVMVERLEYQDAQIDDASNLNGKLVRHYEPGGLVRTVRRDFMGNVQEIHRTLNNAPEAALIDWQTDPASRLDGETYVQITEHDALGRMTKLCNWHVPALGRVAIYLPHYDDQGSLDAEGLVMHATSSDPATGTSTPAIQAIRYNARGQKEYLKLGNGTVTEYRYDPNTFRLTRITTRRPVPSGDQCSSAFVDPAIVQDLRYTYDPVGNITQILDAAQAVVHHGQQRIDPVSRYEYDALYRLVLAAGKESTGLTDAPTHIEGTSLSAACPAPDPAALRNYTQSYRYDSVGNILRMRHEAATNQGWTRDYAYAFDDPGQPASNRLWQTWTSENRATAITYGHDTHGNMLNLANVPPEHRMQWDHRDMISGVDLLGGGRAYYQYDSDKQRTRKRIVDQNGLGGYWERIYLGGYERYRRFASTGSTPVEEIESHHLFEGEHRVLLVDDVITASNPIATPRPDGTTVAVQTLLRYQYGNHLGSGCLELDEQTQLISCEEYHPYGTSACRAQRHRCEAPPKRYRYVGMERDEQSGLNYHTKRHYFAALGRWISCDPNGMGDGPNIFAFCQNNPCNGTDKDGTEFLSPVRYSGVLSAGTQDDAHQARVQNAVATMKHMEQNNGESPLQTSIRRMNEELEDEYGESEKDSAIAIALVDALSTYIPTLLSMPYWGNEEMMSRSLREVDKYTAIYGETHFKSEKGRHEYAMHRAVWASAVDMYVGEFAFPALIGAEAGTARSSAVGRTAPLLARDLSPSPGTGMPASSQMTKDFRMELARFGTRVVPAEDSAYSLLRNEVRLNMRGLDVGTLVDEYTHVFNQHMGRGRFLSSVEADYHARAFSTYVYQMRHFGAVDASISRAFHQLEMLNFLSSGAHIPSFVWKVRPELSSWAQDWVRFAHLL